MNPGDHLEVDRRRMRRRVASCKCNVCYMSFVLKHHDGCEETDILLVCPSCAEHLENSGEIRAVEILRGFQGSGDVYANSLLHT